jgi:hypothetical protein
MLFFRFEKLKIEKKTGLMIMDEVTITQNYFAYPLDNKKKSNLSLMMQNSFSFSARHIYSLFSAEIWSVWFFTKTVKA